MADLYSPKTSKKTETVVTTGPTAFWPILLMGLSLCAILGWQLKVASQLKDHGTRMREQQVKQVDQSRQVQAGLNKFVRDLIEVAKTDEDAKAIVTKFGISVASPAPAAASAAPQATP